MALLWSLASGRTWYPGRFSEHKNDDAHPESYAMYQRVATKHNADEAKARNGNLNVVLSQLHLG